MKLSKGELMAAPAGIPIHLRVPTKAQKVMIDDGGPPAIVLMTQEERNEAWVKNPPKPPVTVRKSEPTEADARVLNEMATNERLKKNNRLAKLEIKREDHTGQRWDTNKSRWIDEEKPMITITTNTRGATQMPAKKDHADMSAIELVEAYNKISGKPPIKKFRDRPTALERLAAAETARYNESKAKTNGAAKAPAGKTEKTGIAGEFGFRDGSPREKFLLALHASFKKQVPVADLASATFGSKSTENVERLGSMVAGVAWRIKESKLPYDIKKDGKPTTSIGLHPTK